MVFIMLDFIQHLRENEIKHIVIGAACSIALVATGVVIHEYCHIVAMRTFFTNINPYMDCTPSKLTCHAFWNGTPKLRAGFELTQETAKGIVAAAGPVGDMTFVAISSAVTWSLRRTHLKVALVFAYAAFITSMNTFTYALITRGSNWGDFVSVQSNLRISHDLQAAILGGIFFTSCALMTHLAVAAIKKLQQRAVTSV